MGIGFIDFIALVVAIQQHIILEGAEQVNIAVEGCGTVIIASREQTQGMRGIAFFIKIAVVLIEYIKHRCGYERIHLSARAVEGSLAILAYRKHLGELLAGHTAMQRILGGYLHNAFLEVIVESGVAFREEVGQIALVVKISHLLHCVVSNVLAFGFELRGQHVDILINAVLLGIHGNLFTINLVVWLHGRYHAIPGIHQTTRVVEVASRAVEQAAR